MTLPAREADHPKRGPLLDELHARSAPRVSAPVRVLHLALKVPDNAAHRDRSVDHRQLEALVDGELDAGLRHHVFERDGRQVTWESHTEYTSFTAVVADHGEPFSDLGTDVAVLFPPEWEQADPAKRIAAVAIEVLPMPAGGPEETIPLLASWLHPKSTLAMRVLGGDAVLAGDFRADADGLTRFVLFAGPTLGPGRIGRAVQRVLDLETYRALAMIGFLRSQELSRRLNGLDPRLVELVDHVDNGGREPEEVLNELLALNGELESLAMQLDFRFGATQAYAAIVSARLDALGDERLAGRQTFREFLSRRYEPAIRTTVAAEARLGRMLERAGRASALLRTRVDVARAAQNQALLHSMDSRAETQLRLQHTVEGLSVVAITYYAIGLLAYLLGPVLHDLDIDKAWVMAALVPVVLVMAYVGMRLVRARIHRD